MRKEKPKETKRKRKEMKVKVKPRRVRSGEQGDEGDPIKWAKEKRKKVGKEIKEA